MRQCLQPAGEPVDGRPRPPEAPRGRRDRRWQATQASGHTGRLASSTRWAADATAPRDRRAARRAAARSATSPGRPSGHAARGKAATARRGAHRRVSFLVGDEVGEGARRGAGLHARVEVQRWLMAEWPEQPAGGLVASRIRVEPDHHGEVAKEMRIDLQPGRTADRSGDPLRHVVAGSIGPCPSRRGKSHGVPLGQSSGTRLARWRSIMRTDVLRQLELERRSFFTSSSSKTRNTRPSPGAAGSARGGSPRGSSPGSGRPAGSRWQRRLRGRGRGSAACDRPSPRLNSRSGSMQQRLHVPGSCSARRRSRFFCVMPTCGFIATRHAASRPPSCTSSVAPQ